MVKRNIPYSTEEYPHKLLDLYDCGDPSAPLFIFFHGGGLESGDKGDGKVPYFTYLMERGISVATADYSMYPNAKFPDFIFDGAECARWCKHHVPCGKIFIGGSSAGAYIAMMLAFDPCYLSQFGITNDSCDEIAGYFFDGGQPTVHFNVLRERGLDTRLVRVDEAAAVYFIDQPAFVDKLPRYRFIYADNDMVNRLEQNLMMYRTMIHLGYPEEKVSHICMKGYGHCQYNGATDTDGLPLYGKMIESFIRGE